MGMTIAGRFAEFLTDLKFDQLPTDVVDRTKLFLLDWLGCAIRGREEVPVKIILEQPRSTSPWVWKPSGRNDSGKDRFWT